MKNCYFKYVVKLMNYVHVQTEELDIGNEGKE